MLIPCSSVPATPSAVKTAAAQRSAVPRQSVASNSAQGSQAQAAQPKTTQPVQVAGGVHQTTSTPQQLSNGSTTKVVGQSSQSQIGNGRGHSFALVTAPVVNLPGSFVSQGTQIHLNGASLHAESPPAAALQTKSPATQPSMGAASPTVQPVTQQKTLPKGTSLALVGQTPAIRSTQGGAGYSTSGTNSKHQSALVAVPATSIPSPASGPSNSGAGRGRNSSSQPTLALSASPTANSVKSNASTASTFLKPSSTEHFTNPGRAPMQSTGSIEIRTDTPKALVVTRAPAAPARTAPQVLIHQEPVQTYKASPPVQLHQQLPEVRTYQLPPPVQFHQVIPEVQTYQPVPQVQRYQPAPQVQIYQPAPPIVMQREVPPPTQSVQVPAQTMRPMPPPPPPKYTPPPPVYKPPVYHK